MVLKSFLSEGGLCFGPYLALHKITEPSLDGFILPFIRCVGAIRLDLMRVFHKFSLSRAALTVVPLLL